MLLRASTALPEKFPQTNLGVYGVTVPLHNDNSYGVMCFFYCMGSDLGLWECLVVTLWPSSSPVSGVCAFPGPPHWEILPA